MVKFFFKMCIFIVAFYVLLAYFYKRENPNADISQFFSDDGFSMQRAIDTGYIPENPNTPSTGTITASLSDCLSYSVNKSLDFVKNTILANKVNGTTGGNSNNNIIGNKSDSATKNTSNTSEDIHCTARTAKFDFSDSSTSTYLYSEAREISMLLINDPTLPDVFKYSEEIRNGKLERCIRINQNRFDDSTALRLIINRCGGYTILEESGMTHLKNTKRGQIITFMAAGYTQDESTEIVNKQYQTLKW